MIFEIVASLPINRRTKTTGGSLSERTKGNIGEPSRFRAFVSYSHADKRAADRLHSRLEGYRLPRHLRSGGNGRIGAIFRDREDLPAANDLTESVKEALAASDSLVVLCSPAAQRSQWVNREIELFRSLHPDRPVLAAILVGEPAEAFPSALSDGREPLAADLRKDGDGARLGFLKLVAGIAGVPLDVLVQRDAQRRVRRVTAVTVAALAAMLIMAAMTTFAIQSRNEAQHQRAEAEGLIEYMLTDLRGELGGVGRLDVMEGVNTRALGYYQAQGDLSELGDESLLRRSRTLHGLGETLSEQVNADWAQVLGIFEEAHRATEAIYSRDPANADNIFNHAQSVYWVGRVDELQKDYSAAHEWYSQYRNLARELAAVEPGTLRTAMELGYGELNMGIMSFSGKDYAAAEGEFGAAIGHFQNAVKLEPDNTDARYELANAYSWISNTHYDAGNYAASLETQREAARIKREIVADDPQDLGAKFDLLIAQRSLAMSEDKLGNTEAAEIKLGEVAREAADLSKQDPENETWREFAERAARTINAR